MKTAQILHGMPSQAEYLRDDRPAPSNSHWLPWLQREFLRNGYLAQTPEMPKPYSPNYEAWKAVFERTPTDSETILIGHSCGAGFLLRWLSENKIKTARTVLVAPYLDPDKDEDPELFNFTIDPGLQERTDLHILSSDNDMDSIVKTFAIIQPCLQKAQYHLFKGYGHFCIDDMKSLEFPELAAIALKGQI